MGRLIVLVLLAVVAVWLVRRALRRADRKEGLQDPKIRGELVRCAHCGVYLPRAEARTATGGHYCSDEHARFGPGTR